MSSYPVTDIEGVGPKFAEALAGAGVKNTAQLLAAAATPKDRKALAEASGLPADKILKFANHADLMRIKGIGGEFAELLEASGVDTVKELRRRNAENTSAKMAEVNAEKNLTRRVPTAKMVGEWVEAAKELDIVLEY